jgi:hypothetical protein
MAPLLAESVPHRARLAWLAGALVASIVAFVATRPAPAQELSPLAIGRCADNATHYVRVDVVPSYHRDLYK